MIMGSGVANVLATGPYTIPLMKKEGYRPEVAGAVECVASNGGHFMPPVMGATVFIMAEFTRIPYAQICIYAAIPAILYYACLFFQIDLMARRDRMRPDKTIKVPTNSEMLKQSAPFILPLIVLVWLLIVLRFPISASVMATMIVMLLCTQFRRKTRFSGSTWVNMGVAVGRTMCTVGIACAASNIIIASVFMTGMSQRIATAATMLAGDSTFLLLLITAIGCYILGMGSGALVLYITVALLIVPTLIRGGIVLIAAHLFAYMMACTAFITPPVALNCFAAAPLAGASPNRVGLEAMKLGIIIYVVPFVFCYRPELLTLGSLTGIIMATIIVTAASFIVAVALAGYLFRRLNWMVRAIFGLVATALFIPNWQFNIIGATVGAALILWLAVSRQRALIPQVER
jgi:TRAP transporter 4TM/12TM fusion protein